MNNVQYQELQFQISESKEGRVWRIVFAVCFMTIIVAALCDAQQIFGFVFGPGWMHDAGRILLVIALVLAFTIGPMLTFYEARVLYWRFKLARV